MDKSELAFAATHKKKERLRTDAGAPQTYFSP